MGKEADALARSYCPVMHPCKDCGHPVIKGYCCETCGCDDPVDRSNIRVLNVKV
jgi:hypothetical protein